MPGRVSLVQSARSGFIRRDRDEPRMFSKIDPSKIPKSFNAKGATHKRGEFRRSVKPANSEGRSVRHCEIQHRFIGDSDAKGSWVPRVGKYAGGYLIRREAGIDGERPEWFTVDEHGNPIPVDYRAFLAEAQHDRYINEFIIPPNDGDKIKDMPGFTGRVTSIMEEDLGTKLRWIAVVHEKHDRAHPVGGPKNKHSHVLMRGVDDQGHSLWISREYLSSTLRNVVQKELSAYPTNDREKGWRLGPMSEEEREKFQQQMALNRPHRIARGWSKATEHELQQMQQDRTRTVEADRDETKERKRDRTRGASMGDE